MKTRHKPNLPKQKGPRQLWSHRRKPDHYKDPRQGGGPPPARAHHYQPPQLNPDPRSSSIRRSQTGRPPSPSGNPSTQTPAPPREGRNAGSENQPKPLVQSKAHILTKHLTSHSLQNLHQDSVLEMLEDELPQLRESRVMLLGRLLPILINRSRHIPCSN